MYLFDQFIYPESTNNLELKNVLQQNVLEKGLGGNLNIFGTRN